MDIMTFFTTIDAAFKSIKAIGDIDKSIDAAGYKIAISDLKSNLVDAKLAFETENSRANNRIEELEKEVRTLKESFAFRENLVEHQGYLYHKENNGRPLGEPFCRVCERKDGMYFQMTSSRGRFEHTCPNCNSRFHWLRSFGW